MVPPDLPATEPVPAGWVPPPVPAEAAVVLLLLPPPLLPQALMTALMNGMDRPINVPRRTNSRRLSEPFAYVSTRSSSSGPACRRARSNARKSMDVLPLGGRKVHHEPALGPTIDTPAPDVCALRQDTCTVHRRDIDLPAGAGGL